jgi:NTE family protein
LTSYFMSTSTKSSCWPQWRCSSATTSGVVARLERQARRLWTRRLNVEIARLAATGTKVRVLVPGAEDLCVMGGNLMNPARRREVFETAVRTVRARLAAEAEPSKATATGWS